MATNSAGNQSIIEEMLSLKAVSDIISDNIDLNTTKSKIDWTKELFGPVAHGYLNYTSPLTLSECAGIGWQLVITYPDDESTAKYCCWTLIATKNVGPRNFVLQTLQRYPEIMHAMFTNNDFQRWLDEMDCSLACFKITEIDGLVGASLTIIEDALGNSNYDSKRDIQSMLQY